MNTPVFVGDTPIDTSIPYLHDGAPMDLPASAILNADGSVTLPFEFPVVLQYRTPGTDQVVRQETRDSLTLQRQTGAAVRKILTAKHPVQMALALYSGLGAAKLGLLQTKMNARDEAAANAVISEMLGGFESGLPDQAEKTPDGVVLTISRPVVDDAGELRDSLAFRHLTALQRRQAVESANLLNFAISLSTGLTPKDAGALFDALDGADAMGVNRVILFLCGSGR